MKKIISILLVSVLFAFGATAQTAFSYTASNPTGAFTNTAVDTMSYTLKSSVKLISIQPVFTKASGTMAGTAILAKSTTGVAGSWVNTDTLTLTNVAVSVPTIWEKVSAARYWRIIRSGATTVTGTSAAKITVAQ